jgi:prolyl 4-hydroxylase
VKPALPASDLLAAAEHDACGSHDAALDALARGTQAGDLECMGRLGLRLLTGDRAPCIPAQGQQLLAEAAERGSGWAANRAAAMLALGVGVRPDWPMALQWLVKAAQIGDHAAQSQLLGLADAPATAPAAGHSHYWSDLSLRINLSAWRTSPPPRVLNDEPRVSIFPGFVTPRLCQVMIGFAEGRLKPARVYDPNSGADIVYSHRSNTVAHFGMESVEFLHVLLQSRMSAACGAPPTHFEAPTQLHYSVGEQIADHYDFVDPRVAKDYAAEIARNGQRIITFIVYLNDAYQGGETSFRKLGFAHRGSLGEGIYFVNALKDLSPDMRMVHAGEPITQGEKWIVTQFIRSRPMR